MKNKFQKNIKNQYQFNNQKFAIFLREFEKDFGSEFCKKYQQSFLEESVKAFRVNTQKIDINSFQKLYAQPLKNVPFFDKAFYLDNDQKLGNSLLHIAGAIYIQEPSSMLPVASIKDMDFQNKLVLDLCASPGGKTTQIASLLNNSGFLISNEIEPSRVKILLSNVERLGFRNIAVTNMSPKDLAKNIKVKFDYIFVDAPCSGEGMFRKDKNAINEWNENLKFYNQKRQLEILSQAHLMLKNGGYLIYSTCTFNTVENESVVNQFCKEYDYQIVSPNKDVLDSSFQGKILDSNNDLLKTRHFFPFLNKGEGQFVACLKKQGEAQVYSFSSQKSNLTTKEYQLVSEFCKQNLVEFDVDNFVFYKVGNYINIMPASAYNFGNLKYLCYGVCFAELIKDRLEISHQFFVCYGDYFMTKLILEKTSELYKKYINGEQINFYQINNDNNANFIYDNKAKYGIIKVEGLTLGGVKIVENALKNHYPKALRNSKIW